jgi:hypothetical protein
MQALRSIAAQLLGVVIALPLIWLFNRNEFWLFLTVQPVGAAISSRLLGQRRWWIPIHLLFLPTAFGLLTLSIPPLIYLLIFAAMALVFWGTVKGDVPLFLSSSAVAIALNEIVVRQQARHLAELGAGVGSVILPLAHRQPLLEIDAWEKAPLPWMMLAWRVRTMSNVTARRDDFWNMNLNRYDVVFAFLSPLVMPALKDKAQREMRPGALLVSSSFPAPEWSPEEVLILDDARNTHLYCYRI